MKKNVHITQFQRKALAFFIVLIAFGWVITEDVSAYERKVLFEDFTSTTCPPCAAFAPTQENYLEELGDLVAPIAFHVWWPGDSDPWWQDNQDENRVRVQYYGVNSVPTLFCDGSVIGDRNNMRSIIRNRSESESPLSIMIIGSIVDDELNVFIRVTSDEELNDLKLFIALKEIHAEYRGVNNWMDHYDAMVKMIPDANGTDFSIVANETLGFELEQDMDGVGWHELDVDNLEMVCWVQADNREVLQAEVTDLNGFNGLFYGNLVNNMTGEGIEGATVTINEIPRNCITDENGTFAFARIPIESFTVNVERWGYTSIEEAEFTFNDSQEIHEDIRLFHPELTLSSETVAVDLAWRESTTIDINLDNTGDGPLEFSTNIRGARVEGGYWDQIAEINTGEITEDVRLQAAIYFQDHFWVAGGMNSETPNHLYKITHDGELVATYEQAAWSNYGWRSLATDGEYLYGADSAYIAQIDPENGSVTGFRIPSPINPTYSVAYDNENDLFWVSSLNAEIYGIDRDGNEISFVSNNRRFRTCGLAYFPDDVDGYKLYLLENSRDNTVKLWKLNIETAHAIEICVLDVGNGESAGGCTLSNDLYEFTWAFLVQMQANNDYLRIYEASSDFYWLDVNPRSANLEPDEEIALHIDLNDLNLPGNETYEAYLQFTHNTPVEGSIWIDIALTVLDVKTDEVSGIPLEYGLTLVYPNPFNAVSNVNFNLDHAADVKLTVHDLTGRQVTELLNAQMGTGKYAIQFNSEGWASGMYILRLTDGSRTSMKKIALLK
ncbi:T9SS type A sorting domain-containing protein [bacterium]|nr:T9SS type A sorting domain-containing protein [bacterium]